MEYTVVDTDAHYFEPADDIAGYFDEPWRSRILDTWRDAESMMTQLFPSSTGDRGVYGRIRREELESGHGYQDYDISSPADVAVAMDHVGIDKCVILSHRMLSFGRIKGEDDRQVVLTNGYADYMLDKVVDPDEGIYTMLPSRPELSRRWATGSTTSSTKRRRTPASRSCFTGVGRGSITFTSTDTRSSSRLTRSDSC